MGEGGVKGEEGQDGLVGDLQDDTDFQHVGGDDDVFIQTIV